MFSICQRKVWFGVVQYSLRRCIHTKKENILVLNCGSSSIKFQILEPESGKSLLSGSAERLNTYQGKLSWKTDTDSPKQSLNLDKPIFEDVTQKVLELANKIEFGMIGHRVVHGGEKMVEVTEINANMLKEMDDLAAMAPLHNPIQTKVMSATHDQYEELPQAAVFDTMYHSSLDRHVYMYPLPMEWYTEHRVRRYGFHGTSHQYVVQEVARRMGRELNNSEEALNSSLAVVSCHLGAGCSVTASLNGVSRDTSMGFSPLEGLMMGQRSGDIDTAIIPYIADKLEIQVKEVYKILNSGSGFQGIAGTPDSRDLEDRYLEGDTEATLAIEMFCYRVAKYIAAYLVPLGKLDAIVFTGGIGEKSSIKRKKIIDHLGALGITCDPAMNECNGKGSRGKISEGDTSPQVWVIPTNEELMIARQVYQYFRPDTK